MDYKDIWTIAVWTTKTNRLKVFRPLGLTEIVHYDHVGLFANACIHALLASNEEDISDRAYQWINYIKTFYTGYFDPGRNRWIEPSFHPKFWCVIGSIIAEQPHANCAVAT